MVVLQFAYRRGKAIQVIPWFSAIYIVVPILGGIVVFGDSLHPMQRVGIVLMLAGVLVLTLRSQGHQSYPHA